MRIQPTRIEQLDAKHPGLRLDVDLMLDKQATLEAIAALVKEKTGETLSIQTISNYKQRRWLAKKLRLEELREIFTTLKAELGEAAISESTQARLFELVDQAMRSGAALDPHFLLKEQRLWALQDIWKQQNERLKQKLEIELEKTRREMKDSVDEAEAKLRGGESLTVGDIDKIRERVFGLPAAKGGSE